jgi:hypothetical protein
MPTTQNPNHDVIFRGGGAIQNFSPSSYIRGKDLFCMFPAGYSTVISRKSVYSLPGHLQIQLKFYFSHVIIPTPNIF